MRVNIVSMTKLHPHPDTFVRRHIGPSSAEIASMLEYLGFQNLSDFSNSIVPDTIRGQDSLNIPNAFCLLYTSPSPRD